MQNSQNKAALITGANKGIGFEVARELGKSGFTVLLGARNPTLGKEAAEKLRAEQLDVRFLELGPSAAGNNKKDSSNNYLRV